MPAVFSTLYDKYTTVGTASGAIAQTTVAIPKGAQPEVKGTVVQIGGSYNLADGALNATNTPLTLTPLPQGSRIVSIKIWPSADIDAGNDFTFNLGTVANGTAFASASTALQAVTGFSTPATIAQAVTGQTAIGANESLLLARAAGDTDAVGTIFFTVELIIP